MKNTLFALLTVFGLTIAASAQGASDSAAYTAKGDTLKADPAAYNLLKDARSTSMNFPAAFGGYSADVIYNDNGTVYNGTVDYAPKVALKFEMKSLADAEAKKLEGDLASLISHRKGSDFNKADGKYPITFGADDKNPIGRLLCLNDELKSCYRVRDNQVVQVNRIMEADSLTINILETTPVENGRFLPRQFTVTYADAKSGAIKKTQAFTDKYEQNAGVWLPKSRRIITTENGVTSVRLIEFANYKVKQAIAAK